MIEMPRFCSISIQSEVTRRRSPRAFTAPADCTAPPYSRNFSVSVVLPASGWLMMAKVRRRAASSVAVDVVEIRVKIREGSGAPDPSPRAWCAFRASAVEGYARDPARRAAWWTTRLWSEVPSTPHA